MSRYAILRALLLACGVLLACWLLQGCGGGGAGSIILPPKSTLAEAPTFTAAQVSGFLKTSSNAEDWSELVMALTVEDPNSARTGANGKPRPRADKVRICIKYDPTEADPLTSVVAKSHMLNYGGSLPADIDVQEFEFTTNPVQVLVSQFKGEAFQRDKRYWISAMLLAGHGNSKATSPACTPQRIKMLPGFPLPPAMMVEKKFWGTVTGPDDSPLANAQVKYVHEGLAVEADKTDANGAYEFFIQIPNPQGTSDVYQVSRGEVSEPTDYVLQVTSTAGSAIAYLDPEYKDFNVNFLVTTPPTAMLEATPRKGRIDLPVAFDASGSSDAEGPIASYDWDFDGDGDFDYVNYGAEPTHAYFTPGVYSATVRVVDNTGCTNLASVTITVLDAENDVPLAMLEADQYSGDAPLPVVFDASGSTDDWDIVSYEFDFGAGAGWEAPTTSTSANYTYSTPGSYTAQVRVTDNEGAQATASAEITVESGAEWHTYALNPPVMTVKTCCAFDGTNKPYVLYVPAGGDAIYRMWEWNGAGWTASVVAGWGDTGTDGRASLAVKPSGEVGVIYSNKGWSGGYGTFFAQRPAGLSSWTRTLIDSADPSGYHTDLTQAGGNYFFSYSPRNSAILKYGHGQPPSFTIENIETMSTTFFTGHVAVDDGYHPYIVTGYNNSGNVKLWYNTTGTWVSYLISTSAAPDSVSISRATGNQMAVVYYSNGNLMLATGSQSTWTIQTVRSGVAPATPQGYDLQVKCDSAGYPHIAYRNDAGGGNVSYSYKDAQGWHHEEVFTSATQTWRSVSLDLASNDLPIIAYRTGTGVDPIEVKWKY